MKISKSKFFVMLMFVLCLCGCGGGGSSSGSGNSQTEYRHFMVGVAPIPRNFPGNAADWQDMLDKLGYVGELATAQSSWRDSIALSGAIPSYLTFLGDQKNTYHYEPVYGINFFIQSGEFPADLAVIADAINDWTNAAAKALYQQVALDICDKYQPRYLGLALEVNAYYLKHAVDFQRFVVFYKDLYDQIKAKSPDTQVFVTFQLEMMKGLGDAVWGFQVDPHWEVLDLFGDKLNLVVFTTYPQVAYDSPQDLPDDYYTEIANHTDKKIAFAEAGWGSDKYSEADQVGFMHRLVSLTRDLDPEFINWIFMHDFPGPGLLNMTGLRYTDGTAKQAWEQWHRIKALPFQ